MTPKCYVIHIGGNEQDNICFTDSIPRDIPILGEDNRHSIILLLRYSAYCDFVSFSNMFAFYVTKCDAMAY